jgi:Arc/MetJ-type ribon-helix-helix transcriptional regulator
MEVHLTEDQKAFIRNAVESGRIRQEEEAVQEAMLLWEERERRRMQILAAADRAEASLARGEGRKVRNREQLSKLADDVKRRARAKL